MLLDEVGNGQQHVLRTWVFIERATGKTLQGSYGLRGSGGGGRRCEDDMTGFVV